MKRGFTLIELLASIVVIAIISLVSIPSGYGYYDNTTNAFIGNWTNELLDNRNIWEIRASSNTGNLRPHNNIHPYKAVYIWERTA